MTLLRWLDWLRHNQCPKYLLNNELVQDRVKKPTAE